MAIAPSNLNRLNVASEIRDNAPTAAAQKIAVNWQAGSSNRSRSFTRKKFARRPPTESSSCIGYFAWSTGAAGDGDARESARNAREARETEHIPRDASKRITRNRNCREIECANADKEHYNFFRFRRIIPFPVRGASHSWEVGNRRTETPRSGFDAK